MVRTFFLSIALSLAGCALSTPHDISLGNKNLNDPSVVAELSRGLTPEERGAFATYALVHWPFSKSYCGGPVFSERLARTVGEAIAETQRFEADLARKRFLEKTPDIHEQRLIAEQKLADEFDRLTLERDMLAISPVSPSVRRDRAKEIEEKMAENRAALRALTAEARSQT